MSRNGVFVLNQSEMEILGRSGWCEPLNEENFMATTRRHFGADQKAAVLKHYLVEKVPISDLCDESHSIHPPPSTRSPS